MTPLATAPRAHADIDDLFQPIIDAIGQATSAVDPSLLGAFDPGFDVDSLLTPALAAAGSVDPTNFLGFSDPLATLDALSADFSQAVAYNPVHEIAESWITSPLGQALDPISNSPFAALAEPGLIGNGVAGTLASPDGGAGLDGMTAGMAGATAADGGTGAAADVAAPASATVPLTIYNTTEPLVHVSVGGGQTIPVLVDTGSAGLVIPIGDLGLQGLGFPTGLGIGAYSGGLDYVYLTLPTTVNFVDGAGGAGIVTGQTSVDAVLFSFPTTLSGPWNFQDFLGGSGADGVLGIGPNAIGPTPGDIVTTALPGALGQGVLINEPAGVLQFGPDPLAGGGVMVPGAPNANLDVSVNGGAHQLVSANIDSGGVYGTIPSSVVPGSQVGGMVPAHTQISVYTPGSSTPLYSYMTDATNGPTVTSGDGFNTGYIPFSQHPVYIGYDGGAGSTTFHTP